MPSRQRRLQLWPEPTMQLKGLLPLPKAVLSSKVERWLWVEAVAVQ